MSIFGKLTVIARLIDTVLCAAQSLACGTGQKLYNASAARGIDLWHRLAFSGMRVTLARREWRR